MEMKKLYKSRTNVKVDGVCAGLADFLNIDPTLVRLIWLIIAFTGSGILIYIVCMIIIPREPDVKDYTGKGYGN